MSRPQKYFNNNKQVKNKALVNQMKRENGLIKASHDCSLLLAMAILADEFDFSQEEMERFVDDYKKIIDSCEYGEDDWKTINDNLFDVYGIKVV